MNILQINLSQYSQTGGTGIAMHRLHTSLNKSGHKSKIFCLVPESTDPEVIYFDRTLPVKALEKMLLLLETELGLHDTGRLISTINIRERQSYKEASVINMHCLHGAFISYLGLPWLTQKPTVYTIHDMWAFSGHCHYSYDCDKWKTGCVQCPYLNLPTVVKRDNSHIEWKLKNWAYSHSNLHIVTPSKWMYNQAKESMLNRHQIHHIPYGIDLEVYRPLDKDNCRSMLGVKTGKKVVLFNAAKLGDFRKGGDLLLAALDKLSPSLKAEILLLVMGEDSLPRQLDIETINFGFVSDESKKAIIYAAADIFIFPTRADNSPLVLYESLACSTPVVSFDVGGVSDLVRPGITGLLARSENIEQLHDCIVELLEDEAKRSSMSLKCREVAQEYSMELYTQRHIELYQEVIKERAVQPIAN